MSAYYVIGDVLNRLDVNELLELTQCFKSFYPYQELLMLEEKWIKQEMMMSIQSLKYEAYKMEHEVDDEMSSDSSVDDNVIMDKNKQC